MRREYTTTEQWDRKIDVCACEKLALRWWRLYFQLLQYKIDSVYTANKPTVRWYFKHYISSDGIVISVNALEEASTAYYVSDMLNNYAKLCCNAAQAIKE